MLREGPRQEVPEERHGFRSVCGRVVRGWERRLPRGHGSQGYERVRPDADRDVPECREGTSQRFDGDRVAGMFRGLGFRRSVPRGSALKETWQILMEASVLFRVLMLYMWDRFHEEGVLPREWQVAEGAQLGKSNGKRGCAGVRLINVLDPGGKIFFKYLWGDARPPRYAYTYGFRKGRRREQAILILHCIRWKLRQMGLSHTTTLHDVANAFPSPEHSDLHAMVDVCAREGDEELLKARCSDTVMVIGGHGGQEIAVRPGCGGLQGDTSMPPMFSATYDPGIDVWIREQGEIVDEGISAAPWLLWGCSLAAPGLPLIMINYY